MEKRTQKKANRVFLVRHGENPANITKEFSYKLVDYDLNERGIAQAKQTAAYFAGMKIDRICSSPLRRAVQTARIIADALKTDMSIVEEFRELNVGDLERRKPDEESWGVLFRVTAEWYRGNMAAAFPNGEDGKTLVARFQDGLRQAVSGIHGGSVIVVGHGGIFTAGVLDLCAVADREGFVRRENQNCSISELLLSGTEPLSAELVRWAYTGHLSGAAADFTNGLPEGTATELALPARS